MSQMLVMPCTKRKRLPVAAQLAFHTVPPGRADAVASSWLARVLAARDSVTAMTLYAGSGWHHSLEALRCAQRLGDCALYAMSAGLGLISADDVAPTYSATFAPETDQVARVLEEAGGVAVRHALWWRLLNGHRAGVEQPISARARSCEVCVCAVGADYLAAALEDLEAAATDLGPDHMFVVCTGARGTVAGANLGRCLLPLDLRMESLLPGVRSTLNSRTVAWLLRDVVPETGWQREAISRRIAERLNSCGPDWRNQAPGASCSDADLRNWVRQQLMADPAVSRSALLRRLRASGRACGQSRFARVMESASVELSVGGAP